MSPRLWEWCIPCTRVAKHYAGVQSVSRGKLLNKSKYLWKSLKITQQHKHDDDKQMINSVLLQYIYRRHKVGWLLLLLFLLFYLFIYYYLFIYFIFFFLGGGSLVHNNFACCWEPGELSSAGDVNTYHIMHSSCNTIRKKTTNILCWRV